MFELRLKYLTFDQKCRYSGKTEHSMRDFWNLKETYLRLSDTQESEVIVSPFDVIAWQNWDIKETKYLEFWNKIKFTPMKMCGLKLLPHWEKNIETLKRSKILFKMAISKIWNEINVTYNNCLEKKSVATILPPFYNIMAIRILFILPL